MRDRSMYDFLALPDPYDDEAARDFVDHAGHEGRADGTGLGGAVVDASGRVVGSAALRLSPEPDLGYWVAPDSRGRGYGAEAVAVLAEFGFGRLALPRVAIYADVRNLASIRTALAAGFAYEGTARGAAPAGALGPGDLASFGRLAGDPDVAIPPTFDPLPPEGLRDGVITLRVMQPDDAGELLETEDEVALAVGFGGPTVSPAATARKAMRAGLEMLAGHRADLAIVDDATGAFAGLLTVRRMGPPGVGGVGYGVHPLFRGRGYTARALRLFAPWAFAHGFVRLELGAKTLNVASQRAALAAGFEPDGVRRQRLRNPDGTYSDEARFALLAPEPGSETTPADPSDLAQPE